jgi:shikimate kinase
MNLVLIGMRSCGKSNISRRLSVYMKRVVLSTDVLISYENQGSKISTIFENNGRDWKLFRELEYLIVKKIVTQDNMIIDTGGGVVVDLDATGEEIYSQRKMELLKENGIVIWLKGDISNLIKKSSGDSNRPGLNNKVSDHELMENRLPFYEQSADITVEIDGKKRKAIAKEIMQRIKYYPEFSQLGYYRVKSKTVFE